LFGNYILDFLHPGACFYIVNAMRLSWNNCQSYLCWDEQSLVLLQNNNVARIELTMLPMTDEIMYIKGRTYRKVYKKEGSQKKMMIIVTTNSMLFLKIIDHKL